MPNSKPKSRTGGSHQGRVHQQKLPSPTNLPPYLKRRHAYLTEMAKTSKRSTANPAFGWSLRAPKKGLERHELKAKCKSQCFLLPRREAFPVCSKYAINTSCNYDCGGILTAYRRARQYGYEDVATAAMKLAKKTKCTWVSPRRQPKVANPFPQVRRARGGS
jgi:hypothetical protein